MLYHITLKNIEPPRRKDPREDLNWFCDSFGFSNGRDIENMRNKVVLELIQKIAEKEKASSEELARELNIAQARVNHHVRTLIESGFLYRQRKQIYLRGGSLKAAVDEMRKDSNRIFDELERIAEDIDKSYGIKNR